MEMSTKEILSMEKLTEKGLISGNHLEKPILGSGFEGQDMAKAFGRMREVTSMTGSGCEENQWDMACLLGLLEINTKENGTTPRRMGRVQMHLQTGIPILAYIKMGDPMALECTHGLIRRVMKVILRMEVNMARAAGEK